METAESFPFFLPAGLLDSLPRDPHNASMSRARRTRFTCDLASGEKKVALAHSADSARRHMESLGHIVLEVRAGDYRALPSRASGAKVNYLSLRQAVAELGLSYPVEIKMSTRAQFQRGLHVTVPTAPGVRLKGNKVYGAKGAPVAFKHRITLSATQSADEMGQALWHELTHAAQVERECVPDAADMAAVLSNIKRAYRDGVSYEEKRWEREANAAMANNDRLRLAR